MRFAFTLALLLPAAVLANGYHLPISNPRDLAFGGSGTAAIQNSASAVYANPAALAGQDGLGIVAGLELITLKSTWTDTTGQAGALSGVDTTPKVALPPELFVAYGDKIGGYNFALGAGFVVAGGGQFYWPGNWPGRAEVVTVDRKSYNFDLVAAFQPIDMLKIGIGGTYMRTTEKLEQRLPTGQPTDIGVQLGAGGGGFGFHLAGELQPISGLRIGVDYRHKTDQTLTGDAHFSNVPPTFATQIRDQGVSHALTFPNVLNAGVSYQLTPDLLVNVGYLLVRWVVYRNDLFSGDQGLAVNVNHRYHNGYGFTVGGEYKLPTFGPVSGLLVRAGVERIQSPQPTDTLHPAIPDANSTSLCLGLGYRFNEKLDIDIGDKLALLDTITTTGTEVFPGQYQTTANFLSAGITYRFGGASPSRGASAPPMTPGDARAMEMTTPPPSTPDATTPPPK